jgi:hypothetical protein
MLETLELFHKQLTALQQAGFGVDRLLLDAGSINDNRVNPNQSAEQLKSKLNGICQQVRLDMQNRVEVDVSLKMQTGIRPLYHELWHRWLAQEQSIEAMQPLMVLDQCYSTTNRGRELSYLHLAFYSGLAALALAVVTKITVPNLRQLQEQIDQTPSSAIRVLYFLSDHSGCIVGALLLLVSIIIYRLIQQRTYLGTARLQSPIDRFFAQEHLASQADESKKLPPDVLQMLDRIYLWIGSRRSQQAAERLPLLVGLFVGGSMALLMGILLFKPLAETLQMIVDGGSPGR